VGCSTGRGELNNVYRILVGSTERKRPLARPRCRWEELNLILKEIEWEVLD
jgi:hypothetical protein